MHLKRIYDHSSGEPVLTHFKILHVGERQKITPRFIEQYGAAGVLSMVGGKIVLKTIDAEPDVVFKIISPPGLYCCHCQAPQGDSKSAQEHVVASHSGSPSPDPANPAGYRRDNFYFCQKES